MKEKSLSSATSMMLALHRSITWITQRVSSFNVYFAQNGDLNRHVALIHEGK
jgi:hypothetical protein